MVVARSRLARFGAPHAQNTRNRLHWESRPPATLSHGNSQCDSPQQYPTRDSKGNRRQAQEPGQQCKPQRHGGRAPSPNATLLLVGRRAETPTTTQTACPPARTPIHPAQATIAITEYRWKTTTRDHPCERPLHGWRHREWIRAVMACKQNPTQYAHSKIIPACLLAERERTKMVHAAHARVPLK
jgi:hypothetical protein